jgi:Ca2+-transporting ATPase
MAGAQQLETPKHPASASPSSRAWHALSTDAVASHLLVAPERGLDAAEAAARLSRDGRNLLPEARARRAWRILLGQFADVMIGILLAAAAISAALGDLADSIAILVIVVVNALIGFVQEVRAERAVAALRAMSAPQARVRREGVVVTLPAAELVRGDVVLLDAGTLVPADLRMVEVAGLSIAEAALTGESEPVAKVTGALPADTGIADRLNLAYKGTIVTRGRAVGLVIATGADTELGRVAALIAGAGAPPTPLQIRLAGFGRRLAGAVLAVCLLIFVAGLARGEPWLPMFMTAVSLAVAAIPEALPAVVAIALALGARRMASRHALVRNLPAVETLGSVSHICADKTGTLTQNRMRVETYWVHGILHAAADLPDEARARLGAWADLHHAMALVNDAEPDANGLVQGEPTEVALLEAALASGLEWEGLAASHPRAGELPFDSERMRMSTLHRRVDGYVAFVKGAPESVLPLCIATQRAGGPVALDLEAARAAAEGMARSGQRVLALASRAFDAMPEHGEAGEESLVFLGLVGLIDPPRASARQAVAECRAAGIVPVMITGDHPSTARAIAASLGILGTDDAVLTGAELAALDDAGLARRLDDVRVYARVDPAQKIRIVAALQAGGRCVAMTGDGVNDAPALKRADIGVAMGKGGTDVAREAADLVLLDDDFATIVHAVREGRRILDNIRRFILYAMTGNTGEIWVIAAAPLLGMPIPLLPIHILWVNLVTDGIPGLALAAEGAERGVMARPPRPVGENLFTGLWWRILWIGGLIGAVSLATQAIAMHIGAHAPTMVFTVLTFSQLLLSLSLRSDRESVVALGIVSNRPLAIGVLVSMALHLALVYVPPLAAIFHTVPLAVADLLLCLVLAASVMAAVEIGKWRKRRAD